MYTLYIALQKFDKLATKISVAKKINKLVLVMEKFHS